MKHPSGSSGSTLTEGWNDDATKTEAGGEVCLDSEDWEASTNAGSVSSGCMSKSGYWSTAGGFVSHNVEWP